MIIKFKSVRELVKHICQENPASANDDRLLVLNYWQHMGIDIPEDVREKILKSTQPEFITRARRWLEEHGEIEVAKEARERRTQGMNEMQNTMLTEKEQELISKQPTKWVEYEEKGMKFMREVNL